MQSQINYFIKHQINLLTDSSALLEKALDQLDLQSTLVLLNILSQKALHLQQKEAKKTKLDRLVKPDTAIKLPISIHKPIAL